MKPSVTRTFGPIHFEDLDPHRFEDLVRELIYDFKDWHSIEATGRSGQDEGFDVRAFERVVLPPPVDEEEAGAEEGIREGNLWMIQAKREKTLGPARIRSILNDISDTNPPYGYILAVAADISKKTYDTFRDELRRKGVSEFHLWSKAELEDMLYQPRNDRILFTFFGISLITRRRTRGTEVRHLVSTKNKLQRILSDSGRGHTSIFVRDIEDSTYPYKDKISGSSQTFPWREYIVDSLHPRGVIVELFRTYGLFDVARREFDFAEGVNLVRTESENSHHDPEWFERRERAQYQWEHLPSHWQAMFHRHGLIRYSDIVLVDEKGDSLHEMPHLYVTADPNRGLVPQSYAFMSMDNSFILLDGFERVVRWPTNELRKPRVVEEVDGQRLLPGDFARELQSSRDGVYTLYGIDDNFEGVEPSCAIKIPIQPGRDSSQCYFEITHREKVTVGELLRRSREHSWRLERLLGSPLDQDKTVTLIEGRRRYDFNIESNSDTVI
jgi:hypothetical protein